MKKCRAIVLAKALRSGETGYSAEEYRHGRYEMRHQLDRDTNTCYKNCSTDKEDQTWIWMKLETRVRKRKQK